MSRSSYPIVKKCLLCVDLKIGVLLYVITEMFVWLFLSIFALENESEFFHRYNLYDFEEYIEDNWYYQMIFGLPTSDGEDYDYDYGLESADEDTDGIDIELRFQNIAINGILMLIFIAYFVLSFVYLVGIAKKNTNFFIPYLLFDFFIIWMSFILILGGMADGIFGDVNLILIRNCSIFMSIKIYPAICNYSLFKKLGGKFEFTREVPSPVGRAVDFERRASSRVSARKLAENGHEMEKLTKNGKAFMTEV